MFQILSYIFTFLPIEDRKNVRLVSQQWNECCNCPAIIRREKLVFRRAFLTHCINEFLQECQHLHPIVELHSEYLELLPGEVAWQLICEKVHSLTLTDECEVSSEMTKNIVK